jgi:hypothetical protein
MIADELIRLEIVEAISKNLCVFSDEDFFVHKRVFEGEYTDIFNRKKRFMGGRTDRRLLRKINKSRKLPIK